MATNSANLVSALSFLPLVLCCAVFCSASEWSFSEQGLVYRDTLIESRLGVTREDIGREGGALFRTTPNPSQSYSLLEIVASSGQSEVWLFDNNAVVSPVLVGNYPTDMQVSWSAEDLFLIERRHMGSSLTIVFARDEESRSLAESVPISNLIFIDPDSALIARLQHDSPHTSKVWIAFSSAFGHSEYRVPVELEYEYASHVLDNITDPNLRGCEFSFVYSDPVLGTDAETITIEVPSEICGNE